MGKAKRYYPKEGDRAYSTGCYLRWNGEKFIFDGYEDDTFFDGELMGWDVDRQEPYIYEEV